jgi:hypothetical protein
LVGLLIGTLAKNPKFVHLLWRGHYHHQPHEHFFKMLQDVTETVFPREGHKQMVSTYACSGWDKPDRVRNVFLDAAKSRSSVLFLANIDNWVPEKEVPPEQEANVRCVLTELLIQLDRPKVCVIASYSHAVKSTILKRFKLANFVSGELD